MQLSKHFKLDEFLKSQTATRLNIEEQFNPSEVVINNLKILVEECLEPLRVAYKKPIYISSGYRSPKLNTAVKGAKNSQHLKGQAADLEAANNLDLYNFILKMKKEGKLNFDQLINEYPKKGIPSWVHISFINKTTNRNQILVIT